MGAKASKSTLKDGAIVGQYEIARLLGIGGMAEVYLAKDSKLGRNVALKLLPPDLARDETLFQRFEREVQQIAKLSHPNIVTMYDFAREGGAVFYTMQALDRGDLSQRIAKGPLEPPEAMRIMRRMADAFAHAHATGLVHRDVKPENILFDSEDEPVLTDFGIAKVLDSTGMTKTGMTVGTPCYISPEQARGKDIDARTDLYALGVILYEMLTGKVPYKAQDSFATIMMHLTEPLPKLSGDLQEYQSLLNRLMAKDPGERFANAKELIKALRTYRGGDDPQKAVQSNAAPSAPAAPPAPAEDADEKTQLLSSEALKEMQRAQAKPAASSKPVAPKKPPAPGPEEDGDEKTQLMSTEALKKMQAAHSKKAAEAAPKPVEPAPVQPEDKDEKTQLMSTEALKKMQQAQAKKAQDATTPEPKAPRPKPATEPRATTQQVDDAAALFGDSPTVSKAVMQQVGRVIEPQRPAAPAPSPGPSAKPKKARKKSSPGFQLTRLHIVMGLLILIMVAGVTIATL